VDHVGVNKKFNGLCEEHQGTGVSVYLPSSAVEQWDATLTAEENKLITEENARKAEENALRADKHAAKADKFKATAKKHKATADSRLLSLVKLLKLQNAPAVGVAAPAACTSAPGSVAVFNLCIAVTGTGLDTVRVVHDQVVDIVVEICVSLPVVATVAILLVQVLVCTEP